MSYGKRTPRKPIYDPENGEPPTEAQNKRMKRQADNVAKYWIDQKRMTVHEMKEKLEKKKLTEEIIEGKIRSLIEEGYLNDETYVEDFVDYKQEYMSERKMREAMLKKGLDESLILKALLSIDPEYQEEGALKVASRRARGTLKEQNVYKRRNKIMVSVMSKGYNSDVASRVTQQAIEENPVIELQKESLSDEEIEENLEKKAYTLAESRVRGTRSKTDKQKRLQSIVQSLVRKGYNYQLSRKVAEQALENEEKD